MQAHCENCDAAYVGMTMRSLSVRAREHYNNIVDGATSRFYRHFLKDEGENGLEVPCRKDPHLQFQVGWNYELWSTVWKNEIISTLAEPKFFILNYLVIL